MEILSQDLTNTLLDEWAKILKETLQIFKESLPGRVEDYS